MKSIIVVCLLLFSLVTSGSLASDSTSSQLRLCAVYPHLKDSYWISINFGMISQARQRGVSLKVLEAGGYQKNDEQWSQLSQCLAWQADAILVGSVSFQKLSSKLTSLNQKTPLFGLVNELLDVELTAATGVSWYQMGHQLGQYLALRHPSMSPTVQLAWFPGPKEGGGNPQATNGLKDAIAESSVELVTVEYGPNEKISQYSLIKQALSRFPKLDYLAGNAVMAEMAISEVNQLSEQQRPQILSHYLTHAVYRGIRRGKILMANSDQMVLQGQMAVNQVVDFLQDKEIKTTQGPEILTLDKTNLNKIQIGNSLSPSDFQPQYQLHSK